MLQLFEQALRSMDRIAARKILKQDSRFSDPHKAIENIIIPAMDHLGEDWIKGTVSLAQLYMCGRITEELVDEILPPEAQTRKDQPVMAIAVLEDYHLLGKRIVYSTMRAAGYELRDYGRVTVDELVKRTLEDQIEVLLISTLMLASALRVKQVQQALHGTPSTLIVGGAPFRLDEQLWKEVGADFTANSAIDLLPILDSISRGDL